MNFILNHKSVWLALAGIALAVWMLIDFNRLDRAMSLTPDWRSGSNSTPATETTGAVTVTIQVNR